MLLLQLCILTAAALLVAFWIAFVLPVSFSRIGPPQFLFLGLVLLGIMSPAMIIAALAGAGVKVIIIINVVVNVGLTVVYVVIRLRGRDHRNATDHGQQQKRTDADGNPQQRV